jgi:protein-S-isoprenylcysteine O-methyltransferase Ste14
MFNKEVVEIFLNKVPDLRNPWKMFLTVGYVLILGILCSIFFYYIDHLVPYAAIFGQLVMALIVTIISYVHFKKASEYREKYGDLAYRYFFYHWMIPYLVTWYACFFHPLFVEGPPLLPVWLAIGMGVILLLVTLLTSIHIERAGFNNLTHGVDIYTVFPEEATVVHGKIYGYIRHPLYFSLMCVGVGLAFFSNNSIALAVAVLQLIPALVAGYMEDQELIEREGEVHKEYIQKTSALIPVNHFWNFLKLLVFLDE